MATTNLKTKKTTAVKKTSNDALLLNETKTEDVSNEEVKDTKTAVKEEKVTKTYRDEDLIECRSITRGYLSYIGKKSGEVYVFENYDDTCEIEVRDLNALRASKSQYLYAPLFVIEDEDFISQPKWKDLKDLYDKFIMEDISEIIEKPLSEFKSILRNLPKGYQTALYSEVATRIHSGEFDSLNKIKAIDEICGTDLYCLIS